ncbi:MAG: RNA 2',3'-cyclic phosphodiesterase [Candidatus Sulfotelmatobacter sp.]
MRLFVALDIDESIRGRIARFLDGVRGFAPDARWVRPESLHVTLKFIGEQSEDKVEDIKRALQTITANMFEMHIRGYGFFPSPGKPRVFWMGIDAGTEPASLAEIVDEKLAALGIPKEEHVFNPHVTLARAARGPGSPSRRKGDKPDCSFRQLQEKLAALPVPEFGTMTARKFFLYQSQLAPGGSRYTQLAGFALH